MVWEALHRTLSASAACLPACHKCEPGPRLKGPLTTLNMAIIYLQWVLILIDHMCLFPVLPMETNRGLWNSYKRLTDKSVCPTKCLPLALKGVWSCSFSFPLRSLFFTLRPKNLSLSLPLLHMHTHTKGCSVACNLHVPPNITPTKSGKTANPFHNISCLSDSQAMFWNSQEMRI